MYLNKQDYHIMKNAILNNFRSYCNSGNWQPLMSQWIPDKLSVKLKKHAQAEINRLEPVGTLQKWLWTRVLPLNGFYVKTYNG